MKKVDMYLYVVFDSKKRPVSGHEDKRTAERRLGELLDWEPGGSVVLCKVVPVENDREDAGSEVTAA